MPILFTCTEGDTGTARPNDGLGRTDPVPTCESGGAWIEVQVAAGELTPVDYEIIGITPQAIGLAWSFGFGAVMLFFSLGYAIDAAITAVKKL